MPQTVSKNESILVITELKGRDLQFGRRVVLRGPTLPFRGAAWSGQFRLTTTWYPGNGAEATQHVLGPMDMPSTWNGVWNTTRMVSMPALVGIGVAPGRDVFRADLLRDFLEQLVRDGALLQVVWRQGSPASQPKASVPPLPVPDRAITRLGRCSSWEFSHERMDDIEWSLTFDWIGRGQKQQKVAIKQERDIADFFKRLAKRRLALIAKRALNKGINPASAPSLFNLADIESLLDAPNQLMNQLKQMMNLLTNRIARVVEIGTKAKTIPSNLYNQLLDITQNFNDSLNQVSDQFSRLPAELAANADNRAAQIFKTHSYINKVQQEADLTAAEAVEIARQLRTKKSSTDPASKNTDTALPSDILTVHIVKQGETFVTIAALYYSFGDLGSKIAKANGFPLYQVAPPTGHPLIIPSAAALGYTPPEF